MTVLELCPERLAPLGTIYNLISTLLTAHGAGEGKARAGEGKARAGGSWQAVKSQRKCN